MIERIMQKSIEEQLFRGRVIILYGARRVGKTTLVKNILKSQVNSRYVNCDLLPNQLALKEHNVEMLRGFLGHDKLIVLDEAQRVENIGMTLKIIADELPDIQVVATGSSSFDLANKTGEPLTGRMRQLILAPLTLGEIEQVSAVRPFDAIADKVLRLGSYPFAVLESDSEARENLDELAGNYLYRDVLEHERVRRPELLLKLLQALAFQIGNEVSVNELSNLLGASKSVVDNYLDLLEKCFVIFRLRPLARNLRNELSRKSKVYFHDLGVRNSLIQNYSPLALRQDQGALWENFCIAERMRVNALTRHKANYYFWRTLGGKEIDLVEERDGIYSGFEFKWGESKAKATTINEFIAAYNGATVQTISRSNCYEYFKLI